MSSQRIFGAGVAPLLTIVLLLVWTFSQSRAQPKGGNIVDETAPDFPALCKQFDVLLKDQFSSAVTDTYKAAYERGLKPVAVPFALFTEPIPDDSAVAAVNKWSACVEVAPGAPTKADDYNLTTLSALRVLRTSCTSDEGANACHKNLVSYMATNGLGLLSTYVSDTSTINLIKMYVFVKATTASPPKQ